MTNSNDQKTNQKYIPPYEGSFSGSDSGVEYTKNIAYHLTCQFLGVDKFKRQSHHTAQKIAFLYDWAKEISKSDRLSDILDCIKSYIDILGTQHRGLSLVNQLFQYARLDADRNKLKRAQSTAFSKNMQEVIHAGLNNLADKYQTKGGF